MMDANTERRKGDRLLFLFSLLSFVLILRFPAVSRDGVRSGLLLCARTIVPSVFPSLILTDLLFSRPCVWIEKTVGRLFSFVFRVSCRGAVAWIAGLLSGFPVGAVTVANDVRRGALSREEGAYLLSFVNNTGPAFLVGGVGLGLFGSVRVGWTLYLTQIPVSLLVGLLFRPKKREVKRLTPNCSDPVADPVAAVVRASENCVRIAGFVCFFSVLSSFLSRFLREGTTLAVLASIMELGCGASHAARLAFPFPALPLVAFAVCFSGVSVHCQTVAALKGAEINYTGYLIGKTVSGAIAFLLSLLFCLTK